MVAAVVIQCMESPSGINMHRDARLEPGPHKEHFFFSFAPGTYVCVCACMCVCALSKYSSV